MTIAIATLSLVGASAYLALAGFAVVSALVLPTCGRFLQRNLNKESFKKVREGMGKPKPEAIPA